MTENNESDVMTVNNVKSNDTTQVKSVSNSDNISIITVQNPKKQHTKLRKPSTEQRDDEEEIMRIVLDPGTKYKPHNKNDARIVRKTIKDDKDSNSNSSNSSTGNSDSNDSDSSKSGESFETVQIKAKTQDFIDNLAIPVDNELPEEHKILMKHSKLNALPRKQPVIDMTDQPVMNFKVNEERTQNYDNNVNITLVDDNDALSSRISRLKSRKAALIGLGME
jgi:hypothetical protein